ncbi:hypothetical protein HDK90DRAFT_527031, partial [Phyllosticta capitalensis]
LPDRTLAVFALPGILQTRCQEHSPPANSRHATLFLDHPSSIAALGSSGAKSSRRLNTSHRATPFSALCGLLSVIKLPPPSCLVIQSRSFVPSQCPKTLLLRLCLNLSFSTRATRRPPFSRNAACGRAPTRPCPCAASPQRRRSRAPLSSPLLTAAAAQAQAQAAPTVLGSLLPARCLLRHLTKRAWTRRAGPRARSPRSRGPPRLTRAEPAWRGYRRCSW